MSRQKTIAVLLAAMLAGLFALVVAVPSAHATVSGNYEYSVEGASTTIVKYLGKEADVVVPATLGGHPVTHIKGGAFGSQATTVKSLQLPSSCTTIEEGAISAPSLEHIMLQAKVATIQTDAISCPALKQIDVSSSNEHFVSLDGVLYQKGFGELLLYPANKPGATFTAPNNTVRIGTNAFKGARNLEHLKFPARIGLIRSGGLSNMGPVSGGKLLSICFPAGVITANCESNALDGTGGEGDFDKPVAAGNIEVVAFATRFHLTYAGTEEQLATYDLQNAEISGIAAKTYNGKPQAQGEMVVTAGGDRVLVAGTDYSVSYKNNVNAGTATVTVDGKGDYFGTQSKTFKINPCSISSASVSGLAAKTYNGKAQTQNPIVKANGATLVSGKDYTLSYRNNINAGTNANMIVNGKGNYTGSKTVKFTINKASQSMTVVGSSKTCSYKNVSKENRIIRNCVTVKNAKGAVTFMKTAGNANFSIDKAGVVHIKKGTPKGVYNIKVKATAAGDGNYKAMSKTVTVKITVR